MTSANEGYIGVTKGDPRVRFKQHEASGSEVGRNIRKHGLTPDDMHILHSDIPGTSARKLEQEYRPSAGIGWNERPGGAGIKDDESYTVYHILPKKRLNRLTISIVLLSIVCITLIVLF